MPLAEVLDALDYSQSPYYLKTEDKRDTRSGLTFSCCKQRRSRRHLCLSIE